MMWILVSGGIVENIIVAEPDVAESLGAEPYYVGASVGVPYDPLGTLDATNQNWKDMATAITEGVNSI